MPLAYALDHAHDAPPRELKDLLGGKGANLAEMASVLGLPVPPGFTITTEACRAHRADGWPRGLDAEVAALVGRLEADVGRRFGGSRDPLVVSVRSGAASSMPGMMDTILNLGLDEAATEGLAAATGDAAFAWSTYQRFVEMFGRIALGVDAERLAAAEQEVRGAAGVPGDGPLDAATAAAVAGRLRDEVAAATGRPFPDDPWEQLRLAVEAVFASWDGERARAYRTREGIPHHLGTAVTVQAMVFGNRDGASGTGVGFTRDPATGAPEPYGDFLLCAQGEDVVAGTRATDGLDLVARRFPELHAQLLETFSRLEAHYRDMCDVEFTIERARLWILQTRVGKRSGAAALRMAVDMERAGGPSGWRIDRAEALDRIRPDHLDQVLHPQLSARGELLTTGRGASPGAGVGRVVLTAEDAVAAAARGERCVLVRTDTSPDDVAGMLASEAVVTTRGGLVSHAAVVARGWGKPAVVGADALEVGPDGLRAGGRTVAAGEAVSVDGTTGEVFVGELPLAPPDPPAELDVVLGWADEVRVGHLGVRANADTAADARTARRFGAEGIGLCRTEHMFLGPERLPVVQRMILAGTDEEAEAALAELQALQEADLADLLRAMDGLPVTVRLLDPPLHEFLPRPGEEDPADGEGARLAEAARHWAEVNPMLGIRGVRLAVLKPGLYAMQARALLAAAARVAAEGHRPRVEVMVPLTIDAAELRLACTWIDEARAEVEAAGLRPPPVLVGTMVETPRAALRAGDLAAHADFVSLGTNDLTQMTLGLSRDDVEARLIPAYLDAGLLERSPFATLDADGVGELVRTAVGRGRAARPDLKVGACGEHGGDPASIAELHRAGVDYVSCSPFRVPIARLAAAHAVLRAGLHPTPAPAPA